MPRVINKIDDHYVDRRKIDNLLRAMFKPDECELRWRQNKWIIKTPHGLSQAQIVELEA